MEVAQEKIDLIAKVIKNNRKYANNEDLYDDFFNETYERSLTIINDIESKTTLEAYLRKIATTSMVSVLKDNGRLRRTGAGYRSTREDALVVEDNTDYSQFEVNYSSIKLPKDPEEVVIQKEILEFVAQAIKDVHQEDPDKKYLQIFDMKYEKGMTQKDISYELGISQSEISKRLYKLMEKIRSAIE